MTSEKDIQRILHFSREALQVNQIRKRSDEVFIRRKARAFCESADQEWRNK